MKLIKFASPNCTPCEMVDSYLKEKGVQYKSYIAIDNPDKAANFDIMSTPVTILLDDEDKEVSRSIGFKPPELDNLIEQLQL